MLKLECLSIAGYKSIAERLDLTLGNLNVLIGANGSGKSNLLSVFKLLNFAMTGTLQEFIGRVGGARSLLHFGPQKTPQCAITVDFTSETGLNHYHCRLTHAAPDTLIFGEESILYQPQGARPRNPLLLGAGHKESALLNPEFQSDPTARFFLSTLRRFRAYQFHDTSSTAFLRSRADADKARYLYDDGGNLAAMLYLFSDKYPEHYRRIVETVRLVTPGFQDFQLEPLANNPRQVILDWRAVGQPYEFGPHQLSDGSLRFMALATLLLQPMEFRPSLIVIDEPELGLHPYAIKILASLLAEASAHTQILVATQSAALVDEMQADDIIVTDMADGVSRFTRLSAEALKDWLTEYTLGQLWEKNTLGGLP